jgi:light-harvesting protein B-800-850 alpha chain
MNNAKMWLVVSPNVGVPIFLGAVAVGSFAVHIAVLSKTNWYSDYLVGEELGSSMASASVALPEGDDVAKAAFAMPNADGSQQVLVILPDGTTTTAILKMPDGMPTKASSPSAVIQH